MDEIFRMDEDMVADQQMEQQSRRSQLPPVAGSSRPIPIPGRRRRLPAPAGAFGRMSAPDTSMLAQSCPPRAPIIGSLPDAGTEVPPLALPPCSVEKDKDGFGGGVYSTSFRDEVPMDMMYAASCPALRHPLMQSAARRRPSSPHLSTSVTAMSILESSPLELGAAMRGGKAGLPMSPSPQAPRGAQSGMFVGRGGSSSSSNSSSGFGGAGMHNAGQGSGGRAGGSYGVRFAEAAAGAGEKELASPVSTPLQPDAALDPRARGKQ